MTDGKPDESNAEGEKTDTPVTDDKEPTSLYDKTEAIVVRQEEANKKREELLKREETLFANQRLAGTTGGKVEPQAEKKLSDEEYADKFMKGEVNPMKEDDISINA